MAVRLPTLLCAMKLHELYPAIFALDDPVWFHKGQELALFLLGQLRLLRDCTNPCKPLPEAKKHPLGPAAER